MADPKIRGLRAAEEIVEICQALQVPREKMHLLVDVVYNRTPSDDIAQEYGGAMITLLVLAWCTGHKLEVCLETELLRVLAMPPEQFQKRNLDKIELGLD